MTTVERLKAAIDELHALIDRVVDRGHFDVQEFALAARLIQPALTMLRSDLDSHGRAVAAGWVEEWEAAMNASGDNSLVDAILRGTE